VFDGGTLPSAEIDTVRITDDELAAFRFCTPSEAAELLRPYVWDRAASALGALKTGRAAYFHRETVRADPPAPGPS
jgi:8-oxo-dGTP diphosphatase